MSEHRASERSLYGLLQLPEHSKSRELVELLLSDPNKTYDEICLKVNACRTWTVGRSLKPKDLTNYRQRKAREESRADIMSLIESESDTLLQAATKNPTGLVARYLRKALTEQAVERFNAEFETMGAVDVSREAARHAQIEQVDRKIEIDQEKLRLEQKRVELQEQAAKIETDKFKIAADTWRFILGYCAREAPKIADELTRRSDELLISLEEWIAEQ